MCTMTRVHYPEIGSFPGYTTEQIGWDATVELADELIRITGAAYAAEVANPRNNSIDKKGNPLLVESVQRHYDTGDTGVYERFLDRTEGIHEAGGRITVLRDPAAPGKLLGYSKIGPAPAMTQRENGLEGSHDFFGLYINNVVVDPNHFGKGIGGILLDSCLKTANAEVGDVLVLDAMHGNNRANEWYTRLGFRARPEVPTGSLSFGNQAVPQVYMYAPNAGPVMANLAGARLGYISSDRHTAIEKSFIA